eukprot:12312681-Alexandrium_andersonii.AAC.1
MECRKARIKLEAVVVHLPLLLALDVRYGEHGDILGVIGFSHALHMALRLKDQMEGIPIAQNPSVRDSRQT